MNVYMLHESTSLLDLPPRFWRSVVSYSTSGRWMAAVIYRQRSMLEDISYVPSEIEIWETDKSLKPCRLATILRPNDSPKAHLHTVNWIGDSLIYSFWTESHNRAVPVWNLWLSGRVSKVDFSSAVPADHFRVLGNSGPVSILLAWRWHEETKQTTWSIRRFSILHTGSVEFAEEWKLPLSVVHVPNIALSSDGRYLLMLARSPKDTLPAAEQDHANPKYYPPFEEGYFLLDTMQRSVTSLPFPAEVEQENRILVLPNGSAACVSEHAKENIARIIIYLYDPSPKRLQRRSYTESQMRKTLDRTTPTGARTAEPLVVIGLSANGNDVIVRYRSRLFAFNIKHATAKVLASEVGTCRIVQYLGQRSMLVQWSKTGGPHGFNPRPDVWRGPTVMGTRSRWGVLSLS